MKSGKLEERMIDMGGRTSCACGLPSLALKGIRQETMLALIQCKIR